MLIRFTPDGQTRLVWDDRLADVLERAFGADFAGHRRRASLIMTVESGPYRGHFYADMSYLAALTGKDEHRVCLVPPRRLEEDVKKDEVDYVETRFIRS